jgi:hypothetical protein
MTTSALVLLLCPCIRAAGQPAADTPWKGVRPRLFFTPQKIARLQQRIEQDDRFRQAWLRIKERADRQLKDTLVSKEHAEGGTGQHGNYGAPSGQIANMASTLGLAYRMTGDKEYAQKLKEALLYYGGLSRWAGDAKNVPPWHSELNTARFCFGYAVGYDCIYDYLSEAERASIAQAMIRLGILPTLNDWVLPGERIHALDSMGHNWWSVCVSMAGLAAMSLLGDEPRAGQWVQAVSEAFPEWFSFQGNVLQNKSLNFDRNGAFYESVGYADYALSEYLLFRLAYTNVYRDAKPPEIPVLKTAGDFFVHACYPTAASVLSVDFGDSSLRSTGAKTLRLLLANGYQTEAYDWYLGRTNPGLDDPIGLVYYEAQSVPRPPDDLPLSILYPDIGWAVLRSSWQDNATMLAVKSGFTWNHAHPDAGSFVLFHEGKPLIIDSGSCSYSRPEYTSYYRQSKAHNVVLIDGQAQNPEDCSRGDRGVKTPGWLHDLLDLAGVKYVFADATGPTSWKFSRNYRHFVWIDDVILIFDDIRTHEPGKLEWLLHYEGSRVGLAPPKPLAQEEESVGQAPPYVLILSNEDAKVTVRPLFPQGMQVAEKKGLKDRNPDKEVAYLALSPEGAMREAKFVVAIMPMRKADGDRAPRIEPLTADNAIGARIRDDKTTTDVWLNLMADGRRMHRNSNNIIDGWDTDAYLIALTRAAEAIESDPDSITRCFVACGSYLRKNGKVTLQSLSKVDAVFTCQSPEMKIALHGQPVTRASIRATAKPRSVNLNGQQIDPTYDAQNKTVTFRVTTHE